MEESERTSLKETQPFLGVPFTAKDCFAVQGLSWTVGLKKRSKVKGDFDADSVQAMRRAGAIPIGKMAIDEANICMY